MVSRTAQSPIRMCGIYDVLAGYSSLKRTFLDFKKDEVLHTDGQTRSETFPGAGGGERKSFR